MESMPVSTIAGGTVLGNRSDRQIKAYHILISLCLGTYADGLYRGYDHNGLLWPVPHPEEPSGLRISTDQNVANMTAVTGRRLLFFLLSPLRQATLLHLILSQYQPVGSYHG